MKVLIDADACPVTQIATALCRQFHVPCFLLCDTCHAIYHEGAETLIFDKGADSVDYALANRISKGDIVITQDYGLASLSLARGGRVLHQDGWEYHEDNISALLLQRHEARKYRASGGRIKGPKKRTRQQDEAFRQALQTWLQG